MVQTVFDWSKLDRITLYNFLNGAKNKIVGQVLSIEQIHQILSQQTKKFLPVRTKMLRSAEQEHGIIYIGGCYFSDEDEDNEKRFIEIVFSYFVWDEYLKLTKYRWKKLCEVFADTVLHEIIHMRQYRTRKFKTIPGYQSTAHLIKQRRNQNYYGHPDEIGAYAFNIACELHSKFGNNWSHIKKYLDSNKAARERNSSYIRYLKTFDCDHSHPVIKKLKKKVIYYLPYAKIGKPFKTSDYLTY